MTRIAKRQSRDLLDAVEEFKPLDFRRRIQAAGSREYGEDVADRNMRLSMTVSSPNLYTQFSSGRSPSAQTVRVNSRTKSIDSINKNHDSTAQEVSFQADSDDFEVFSRRNKNRLSLDTYNPSGHVTPTLQTSRSTVTTPGHRGGMTPGDFNSPDAEFDVLSRQYYMSPTGSNFSIPRSPGAIQPPIEAYGPQLECIDGEDSFEEEQELSTPVPSNRSSQRRSVASGGHVSTKAAARFSQGTFRSSLASSVTSRYPSMDFMPLGYPRLQGNHTTDLNSPSDSDLVPTGRSQSLCKLLIFVCSSLSPKKLTITSGSHRHSRSNSSGDSYSQQRTRSLLTTPSGLQNLVEVDGQTGQPHNSSTRDWALVTPSNGSTSSSSNGLYSGASGSMRPASLHTKATSIDSIPRPPSSQSCLSASVGQSASGWSPSTTRSTEFNIDDYVSSDDDSFTTEKRPSGEGEEELLFKDGYGATGAALPGLLESMMDTCPPPVVGSRASQLTSPPGLCEEEEGEAEGDDDAAEAPDIDDRRLSANIDLTYTLLRNVQDSPENSLTRTFGRRSGRLRALSTNKPIPSWLPSDDWARPAPKKRPTPLTTSSNKGMYEETRPPHRGQIRLSALGTLHGRNPDWVDNEGAKRASGTREPMTSPIREEAADPAVVARLRKEAKARKREDVARTIRENRMTRAFGGLDEAVLVALEAHDEGEMEERGRTRERVAKGESVVLG